MILRWGRYPVFSRWAPCNHKGPSKEKRAVGEVVSEFSVIKTPPAIAGFEAGKRGMQAPLEAGQGKETRCPPTTSSLALLFI